MIYYILVIGLILLSITITLTYERLDPLSPIRIDTTHDYTTNTDIEYSIDDTNATFSITIPKSLSNIEYGEKEKTIKEEAPLFPSFAEAGKNAPYPILPSIEFCGQKGKFFDDGMYSAVEIAIDKGFGIISGGRQMIIKQLIEETLSRYKERDGRAKKAYREALIFVSTAYILGGTPIEKLDIPDEIKMEAKKRADDYIKSEPYESKPIGFYTWTEDLMFIFRRDRYLQRLFDYNNEDEFSVALALSSVIGSTENMKMKVSFIIDLFKNLTNPTRFSTPIDYITVFDNCDKILSDDILFNNAIKRAKENNMIFTLFPPSISKEVDMMNKMTQIGGTSGLMFEFIKAIKDGRITLKPDENSGWYQYQQFALECLLKFDELYEARKIKIDENYRKRLEISFMTMLTQARETHIKMLEKGVTSAQPPIERVVEVIVSPEFTIEPIATYYLRVARAYRFLENILNRYIGSQLDIIKPMYNGKEAPESLKAHLKYIKNLFYGFYLLSCVDIGIEPQLEKDEITDDLRGVINQAKRYLTFWQDPLSGDMLMSEDIRVIVPVGRTEGGILCWAVLGVKPIVINVSYDNKPVVKTKVPGVQLEVEWAVKKYTLLVPEFIEVIVPSDEPFTRDEFRKICDECKTPDEIKRAIEKYKGSSEDKGLMGIIGGGIPILPISIIGGLIIIALISFIMIKLLRKKKKE